MSLSSASRPSETAPPRRLPESEASVTSAATRWQAVEHLDSLTRKYTAHQRFYGFVYPEQQRARETRIIVRIRAQRVSLDAIHIGDH
jgi:hypothetical protein